MKKFFLLLINLCICCNIYSQELSLPQLIQKVENSIFTIFAMDENGNVFSQGSGFYIDNTGIGITNFHVLDGAYTAQIKMKDGAIIPIEQVIDFDKEADLVKFQIKTGVYPINALTVVTNIPLRGSDIINLSSPLGLEQSVSTGIVSAIRKDHHGTIIQMTTPISPGSSGSPVFNNHGQVLGVATFHYADGQNLNFAVSAIEINNLSRKLKIPISAIWNNPLETKNIRDAIVLSNKGNLTEAIDILKQEVQTNKLNHLAWYELACAERKFSAYSDDLNGLENAFSHITVACKLDSLNDLYWLESGVILSNINDAIKGNKDIVDLSIQSYNRSTNINPYNNVTYYNFAKLLEKNYVNKIFSLEILPVALKAINMGIELNPTADNYVQRARIETHMKKIGESILDCDKAINLAPEYPEAYFVRGDAKAFELLDYYGGLVDIEKAIALSDYYYSNPKQLAINKSDMLGLKAIIYWNLFVKEKDNALWNKMLEAFDEAYRISSNDYYIDLKNFYVRKYKEQ